MAGHSPKYICLMGPTAAGKTELALALARHFDGEIVSVDSAQVYRGMDIGTAKPRPEVLAAVPHHLIDIRDPAEPYSAEDFRRDAREAIASIQSRGRLPLLAGGTMLYFRALLRGLSPLPSSDPGVRSALDEEEASRGVSALHERLAGVDPESASRIHPNDPQRIKRALEVYELSGRPMSALLREAPERSVSPGCLRLVLMPADRAGLHRSIERRFQAMLDAGLVEEVKRLHDRGDLHEGLPSVRSVGYRQVWQYLEGSLEYRAMVQRAIAATRQLAKRQLTWLRREEGAAIVEQNEDSVFDEAVVEISQFLAGKP